MSAALGYMNFFSDTVLMMWMLLGLVLICLELFVPGGIVGSIGLCIIFGTILFGTSSVAEFFLITFFVFALLTVLLFLIIKLVPRNMRTKGLFLNMSLTKQEGFSSGNDLSFYLGREGLTKSVLRPSGKMCIGEELLDAQSENTFIEPNRKVKVIGVQGNKLIVREMK